jgi:hypothetical protein
VNNIINAVMAIVAQHPVLAAVAAVVVVVVAAVVVAQLHWALVGRARWERELLAEREAEERLGLFKAELAREAARESAVQAAYREREAARHAAWNADQLAVLRNKAVLAIRWRNGLLASKEAMTARQYSDWSDEVRAASRAVKAAIVHLNDFPTNDNLFGSDTDEAWLCRNFGPRV